METAKIEQVATAVATALPHKAHQTAIALAGAYGHLWANTWPALAIRDSFDMSADTVAELLVRAQVESEASNQSWAPSGITVADAIVHGPATGPYYRHVTGSGRLVWEIRPEIGEDGKPSSEAWLLDLEIHRPALQVGEQAYEAGQAIMVRYSTEEGWQIWHHNIGAPFYGRHVRALEEALHVLKPLLGEFPQGLLQELHQAGYHHAEKTGKVLAGEFTRKFGTEAAGGLLGALQELGEECGYMIYPLR